MTYVVIGPCVITEYQMCDLSSRNCFFGIGNMLAIHPECNGLGLWVLNVLWSNTAWGIPNNGYLFMMQEAWMQWVNITLEPGRIKVLRCEQAIKITGRS